MTDDAESRSDGGADTKRVAGDRDSTDRDSTDPDPTDPDSTDPDSTDRHAAPSEAASEAFGDEAPSFGDLSLPQRVFVAAVQNPTRGVVILGLLAFGFSFYVALWLVFPRVAAFLSVIGAVLIAIVALVYLISDRISG